MKRLIVLTIVVATLLTGVARANTLYQLQWESQIPLDVATISVDVVGSNARIVSTINTQDATTGWVMIDADKACVAVTMKANTVTGVSVTVSRQWDADCYRTYLPILAQDTPFAELP
jgi:hypothetical protein